MEELRWWTSGQCRSSLCPEEGSNITLKTSAAEEEEKKKKEEKEEEGGGGREGAEVSLLFFLLKETDVVS